MTAAAPEGTDARVVPGPFGERFRLQFGPATGPVRGTIVALPALFEEMNKCRRMTSRLARAAARAGWTSVVFDLHGCGDSAGELRDASWSMWLDEAALELQAARPGPLWLWATRGGALLVPALLQRLGERPCDLLLWQPVTSGATHLAQFLRLHAAARILNTRGAGEQASPAQRLKAGETIEVGGYELNPALAKSVEQARLDLPAGFAGTIVWCELDGRLPGDEPSAGASAASPAAARAIEQLRSQGRQVELECVDGPHFWLTQEIEESDALIERSLARLATPTPAARAPAEGLA